MILLETVSAQSYIRSLLPPARPVLLGVGLGALLILGLPGNGNAPAGSSPAGATAMATMTPSVPSATTVPTAPSRAPSTQALPAAAGAKITIEPLPAPQRLVHVESVNTGERASFNVGPRGFVPADQVAAVEAFFRCRRSGSKHAISAGVLVLLADIADRWPGRTIEIISGFRAAPYGAPHSRHFSGNAIDLRVRGVRTSAVRDFVWREHEGIGVGHYAEGDFVHVDARSEDQEIAWSSPNENTLPVYNPRWAKRARRGLHRGLAPAMATAMVDLRGAGRAQIR